MVAFKGSPGVRLFLSAAILSAALLPGGSIAGATGRAASAANVLLLNAYHLGYRWSDEIVDGVRETLSTRAPRTQLFVEHLDSKRIFRPAAFDRLADLIREKYRYLHFDAIIAADNNSLAYLKQHRQSLFAGIPAVFCGVNDLNPDDLVGLAPVTGVNEAADVRETVELALRLMPATRRVVVITDTTPTGRSVKGEIGRVAATYTDTVTFAFWDDLAMEALLDRVAGLKSDDIVLYTFFFRDRVGRFFEYDESAQRICSASPVPVFGMWEFNLGHGIVGGKLVSGFEQGRSAAEMVLQLLGGATAEQIPVKMRSPNRYAFDHAVLQRFGIKASRLPAGSLFVNRPPSIYQAYKPAIWSGLTALVALMVLVVFLLTNLDHRRHMERRLRRSQRRMAQIIDFLPDPTFVIDTLGQVVAWNRAMETLTGFAARDMLGKGDYEYALPFYGSRQPLLIDLLGQWQDDAVDKYEEIQRIGDCLLSETRHPLRILGNRHFTIMAGPIYDDAGAVVGGIETLHDITELKNAKAAIVEASRMLRLVIDTIPVRVFWKDTDSRYLGCNQPFAEDAGQASPEDLIGKDDYAFSWGVDQADSYRRDDRAVMASGKARLNSEERQTTPDGRTIWLQTSKVPMRDAKENIVGVLGTYQDVTDRKRAEEELSRLRNYLVNIIDSMPSVLVGVDRDGRVTQWNRQAEKVTGLTYETAQSRPLADVFPRLIDKMDLIHTAIRDRRVLKDAKVSQFGRGETRFEDLTVFPLVANGVDGAVIRVDDVTDRVRLEEMMIQSEKMLSVGGLAAGMAHEINNPLAGIMQNAAVLASRLSADLSANHKAAQAAGTSMAAIRRYIKLRQLNRMLDNIRTSGERAAAIVRNMLSFARKSDRIVSSHDLRVLMDEAVELAQTDYDMKKHYDFKQIQIVRQYAETLDPVPCEKSKLQQVFLNILKNGAEAMADNMAAKAVATFTLKIEDDGSWVQVEIIDNGPGMEENTRRRVFEPFFTTKPAGKGTGLGLSVSYFIITENHSGKMDVFSTAGKGTRFVIRLPKSAADVT
jgi:PAS domain S-box-containing protein